MPTYQEDESDPGVDDPNIDYRQVISDLKSSRHVLHVAEYAAKTFEENLHHSEEHHATEFSALNQRKELAEKAILACETSCNEFLRDMFVRFGRTEKEALAFRKSPFDVVKAMLSRRILLKKRHVDSAHHQRVLCSVKYRKNDFQRQSMATILEDKKASGDIMFRTTIPNAYLKRVARLTRQLIQGINSIMTYGDLIRDFAGKFNRIREYMHDDAVIFTRNINDLVDRIKHQQKEIDYLRNILHESTHAAERAEKAYFTSAGSSEETEFNATKMLKELTDALEAHQDLCAQCTTSLVDLNEKFKTSAAVGCLDRCPEDIKRYPYAVHGIHHPTDPLKKNKILGAQTDLTRIYQTIQGVTKARDPVEAIEVFRDQTRQANLMQAQVDRLEHLLKTVLRPEFTMFDDEFENSEAIGANRAAAAEKSIKEMQDNYDLRVEEARAVVNTQRDSAQELDNFMETLHAINDRIASTFNDQDALQQLTGEEGVADFLETTGKNLRFVGDRLTDYFRSTWDKLQLLVEDSAFLEYRGTKIPSNNNRIMFDSAEQELNTERLRDQPPTPHPK